MFKKTFAAASLAVLFSGSVFAFHCPADMKKIDEALANSPAISAESLAQVKALRSLGEEQHNAGNHAESVETLAEAMDILGVN